MARRIVNRMEKRAEYEAYEATEKRKGQDDEDEHEDEADEELEAEADSGDDKGDDEAEAKPKKKAVKPAKPRARTRTPKLSRMKVVWVVFSNTNQRVAAYEYPKRHEAEEHAARLMGEKKSTFFVQPVKEPIEEKKE